MSPRICCSCFRTSSRKPLRHSLSHLNETTNLESCPKRKDCSGGRPRVKGSFVSLAMSLILAGFRWVHGGCWGSGGIVGQSACARRKQAGIASDVRRAHWPAAFSSEQSCGSPCKGTRARGSRCPPLVCAGVRTCGEFQRVPQTRPGRKRREPSHEGKNPNSRWRASRSICGKLLAGNCRRRTVTFVYTDANITPESRSLWIDNASLQPRECRVGCKRLLYIQLLR